MTDSPTSLTVLAFVSFSDFSAVKVPLYTPETIVEFVVPKWPQLEVMSEHLIVIYTNFTGVQAPSPLAHACLCTHTNAPKVPNILHRDYHNISYVSMRFQKVGMTPG